MNQVLRLARRDGDEWVRQFASVLGPFPDSHRINSDQVTKDNLDGLAEELEEASECVRVARGICSDLHVLSYIFSEI